MQRAGLSWSSLDTQPGRTRTQRGACSPAAIPSGSHPSWPRHRPSTKTAIQGQVRLGGAAVGWAWEGFLRSTQSHKATCTWLSVFMEPLVQDAVLFPQVPWLTAPPARPRGIQPCRLSPGLSPGSNHRSCCTSGPLHWLSLCLHSLPQNLEWPAPSHPNRHAGPRTAASLLSCKVGDKGQKCLFLERWDLGIPEKIMHTGPGAEGPREWPGPA